MDAMRQVLARFGFEFFRFDTFPRPGQTFDEVLLASGCACARARRSRSTGRARRTTARECHVLSWGGALDAHALGACRKLKAVNRIQTVAIALRERIVGDYSCAHKWRANLAGRRLATCV